MFKEMLYNEKIMLKAIEKSDLEQLLAWRNNKEFRKHFREYRELNMQQQEEWFDKKVNHDPNTIMFAIRDIRTNQLLGCCGLCYVNWIERHADLSLYIGYKDKYIDNEGLAMEACKLLFDYAFKEINLNKIWTEIFEFDEAKKKLFARLNMKIDGRLRENHFHNGQYWDSLIISILKKEFLEIVIK